MSYFRLLVAFAKSRSRKRRPRLPAVSSPAIVNTDLNPRGSVLVGGELWTAETTRGDFISRQTTVTIVGFRNHLLLVEAEMFLAQSRKGAKKPVEARQRFASLRLCARNISGVLRLKSPLSFSPGFSPVQEQ